MIFINDLFSKEGELFRILWKDESNDLLACIYVDDEKGVPELMPFSELTHMMREGLVTRAEVDPYSSWPLEDALTKSQKKKRDRNWQLIESLVRNEPVIFFPEKRAELLKDRIRETGVSIATFYNRTYALTALIKDGLSQSLPSEKLLMKSQIASLSASFLTR